MPNLLNSHLSAGAASRKVLVILRWLIIAVIAVMMFYSPVIKNKSNILPLILLLSVYIATNLGLMMIDEKMVNRKVITTAIFVVDVILVSLSIYLTHGFATDLYLIYFIIIFMAGSGQDVKYAIPMALIAAVVYGVLLLSRGNVELISSPGVLIRVPFIFVVSLSFLFYAQREREKIVEKMEKLDKMSLVGEMVAGIMHELNTPLTRIVGFTDVLSSAKDIKEKEFILSKLTRDAAQAKAVILSISKFMYQGRPELKEVTIDEIIDSAFNMAADQLKLEHIEVEKVYTVPPVKIVVDTGQIQQVMMNLINNARHAVKNFDTAGTGKKIVVSTTQHGHRVSVKFYNTGPVIPQESMERLFEPFFTTKKRGEGTGLGLAICYRIMKNNGGSITIKNAGDGTGVEVILTLPSVGG
ncbi:MAG: HAMP domain-containing sensor histidine kinase [Elusimicrobiota bacterium]